MSNYRKADYSELRYHHTYSFKLFLFFSLVMLLALLGITYYLTSELSDRIYEQELKTNRNIALRTADYLDARIASARKTIQDIYFSDNDLQTIINSMLNEEDSPETLKLISQKERFENLFISALYNDEDIVDIILLGNGNKRAYVFSKKWSTVILENRPFPYAWAEEIQKYQSSLTIIPSHEPLHMTEGPDLVYSAATSIYDAVDYRGAIGTIIINYRTDAISQAYDLYREEIKGDVYVFNGEGNIIFDSSGSFYGKRISRFHGENMSENNTVTVHTANMDLRVSAVTAEEELYKEINSIKRKSYAILCLAILIILIFYYKVSRLLFVRIYNFLSIMEKVEKGNLEARIRIGPTKDELSLIASRFNNLCGQLEDHIEKSYISEIKIREAELMSLQRKINPHFIYNTLEIIRVKALLHDDHDTSEMILLLSNLFRKSLRTKDMVITLKDEIEYCRIYLDLNKIRYRDRMSVEYQLEPDLLDGGVLKMILQPLIENVIVHGVDGQSGRIEITLKAYRRGSDICIEIKDNGKGIDKAGMEKINQHIAGWPENNEHMGLPNVNDRLRIAFGPGYGLKVESRPNEGTAVFVTIPLMSREEMIQAITQS